MSNVSRIVVTLAIFAALMPFSGFPAVFKDWFVLVVCLSIAGLLYLKEKHMLHTQMRKNTKQVDTFSENGHAEPQQELESTEVRQ